MEQMRLKVIEKLDIMIVETNAAKKDDHDAFTGVADVKETQVQKNILTDPGASR